MRWLATTDEGLTGSGSRSLSLMPLRSPLLRSRSQSGAKRNRIGIDLDCCQPDYPREVRPRSSEQLGIQPDGSMNPIIAEFIPRKRHHDALQAFSDSDAPTVWKAREASCKSASLRARVYRPASLAPTEPPRTRSPGSVCNCARVHVQPKPVLFHYRWERSPPIVKTSPNLARIGVSPFDSHANSQESQRCRPPQRTFTRVKVTRTILVRQLAPTTASNSFTKRAQLPLVAALKSIIPSPFTRLSRVRRL